MGDMRLTNNFTLGEFTHTDYADLLDENKCEGAAYEGKLRQLALNIMQPIRERWGRVKITSGYRCKALNDKVGSTDKSQHRKGEACDFIVQGMTSDEDKQEIVDWCIDRRENGIMDWHQMLIEPGCIHVALPTGFKDGQVGTWAKKKVAGKWTTKKKSKGA